MSDVIKMDYPLMEDMNRTFLQGVEQLQDTTQQMLTIASTLEDGALLGRGGVAFTEAIQTKLVPAIGRLTDKFDELAKDVIEAMNSMKEADKSTEGMY